MTLRGVIVSFIMTIVLSIMVLGYAALQQRIDIEAEATVDSTYRVEITKLQEGTITGNARSTNAPQYNGLSTTLKVGLTNETDVITYTLEITNYSTVDVRLNNTEIGIDGSDNIKVVKSGIRNGDIMNAGSLKVVTIQVTLKEATSTEQTGTINIRFDFDRLKGGIGEIQEDNYNAHFPLDYKELEYIESTGTQYIDTGYAQKIAPKIVADMMIMNDADTDYFGNLSASSDCFIVDLRGTIMYYRYGSQSYTAVINNKISSVTTQPDEFHKYIFGDDVYIDEIKQYTVTNQYDFSNNTQSINIFRGRNFGSIQLKYLKLYDGDNLVRDFIPCYLKSTGEIGLYDLVENKFYGNNGTGLFLKGDNVDTTILSSEYQQVEYIESTGTQYIDTGYVQKIKPKIVTEMAIINSADTDLFGNLSADNGCFIVDTLGKVLFYRYGLSSFTQVHLSFPIKSIFKEFTFGPSVLVDNELIHTVTNQYDFSNNTQSINIFRGRNFSSFRLKNLQLYDGEELVRDFIPALDNNNIPCLYDTVSGETFYNRGSGTFLYKLKE